MFNPHADFSSGSPSQSADVLVEPDSTELRNEFRACRPLLSSGALLLRTAECLTALLQAPTVLAGLNESRFNVLDALRRKPSETCSQTELATYLLQSESNLSTLLDRMKKDGLISRVRSESDRRVALIGLSTAGREALARADLARERAADPLLRMLDDRLAVALAQALELLRRKLERALGVAGRMRTTIDVDRRDLLSDENSSSALENPPAVPARRRKDTIHSDGPER